MPGINQVIKLFANLLDERFTAGAATTEDSVRYTFFHALLSSGYCKHTDVVLEYPHTALRGQKIDVLIAAREGLPPSAIEFNTTERFPASGT